MLLLRQAALSAVALACLGSPGLAQDYQWSGFSLYAGGGAAALDTDIAIKDTSNFSAATECDVVGPQGNQGFTFCVPLGPISGTNSNAGRASDNDTSILGTVGVGADYEFARGFLIGVFADIDWSDAENDFDLSETSLFGPKKIFSSSTSVDAKLDYDYSWTVGGRIGILSLNRQALIYALGGYTELHTDGSANVTNVVSGLKTPLFGDTLSVGLPSNFSGFTVGAGAEVKLTQAWSLKLEGRYANMSSETVSYSSASDNRTFLGFTEFGPGCNGNVNSGPDCAAFLRTTTSSKGSFDIDPDIWSGRVTLSYQFN